MRLLTKALLLTSSIILTCSSQALASNDLDLKSSRLSLHGVDDPAGGGRWQYEGGKLYCPGNGTQIGYYAASRRVTVAGTSPLNTAQWTITLFFELSNTYTYPKNITIQGAHNYSSGDFGGSVSAATYGKSVIGRLAYGSASDDTITIKGIGEIVKLCN